MLMSMRFFCVRPRSFCRRTGVRARGRVHHSFMVRWCLVSELIFWLSVFDFVTYFLSCWEFDFFLDLC